MLTRSLFARLEARPGKEDEVAAFLRQGLQLAQEETTTPVWFALRLALMAQASSLLATPPVIEHLDVLGAKLPE